MAGDDVVRSLRSNVDRLNSALRSSAQHPQPHHQLVAHGGGRGELMVTHQQRERDLQDQLGLTRRENLSLRSEREDSRQLVNKLTVELQSHAEERDRLQREVKRLREEISQKDSRYGYSHEDAAEVSSRYEYHILRVQKDLERSQDEGAFLRSALAEKESELVAAQRQLKAAQQVARNLDDTQWQVVRKTKDNVDAQQTIRRLEMRLSSVTAELETALKEKTYEIDSLQNKISAMEKDTSRQLTAKDERLRSLEADLQQIYASRTAAENAVASQGPSGDTSALLLLVEGKQADIVRLQNIVREQRKQINSLHDKVIADSKVRSVDDENRERGREEVLQLQRQLLQEKEEEIRNLTQLTSALKEQITILHTQLSTTAEDTELFEMHRKVLNVKDEELSKLQRANLELTGQLQLAAQQHEADRSHIAALEDRLHRDVATRATSLTLDRSWGRGLIAENSRRQLMQAMSSAGEFRVIDTDPFLGIENARRPSRGVERITPSVVSENSSDRITDLRRQLAEARAERETLAKSYGAARDNPRGKSGVTDSSAAPSDSQQSDTTGKKETVE